MKNNDEVWIYVEGQEVWHPAHFAEMGEIITPQGNKIPAIGVWISGRTSHSAFGKIVYYAKWHTAEEHDRIREEWDEEHREVPNQ